jgi:hypothetical protein
MLRKSHWLSLTAALVLAGCGGGSDEPSKFGAIAYSASTTKAVMTWNENSQASASGNAFKECGGGDCAVLLEFTSCGAIAGGPKAGGGVVVGVASASTREQAQIDANNSCNAKGGVSCQVIGGLKARCAADAS